MCGDHGLNVSQDHDANSDSDAADAADAIEAHTALVVANRAVVDLPAKCDAQTGTSRHASTVVNDDIWPLSLQSHWEPPQQHVGSTDGTAPIPGKTIAPSKGEVYERLYSEAATRKSAMEIVRNALEHKRLAQEQMLANSRRFARKGTVEEVEEASARLYGDAGIRSAGLQGKMTRLQANCSFSPNRDETADFKPEKTELDEEQAETRHQLLYERGMSAKKLREERCQKHWEERMEEAVRATSPSPFVRARRGAVHACLRLYAKGCDQSARKHLERLSQETFEKNALASCSVHSRVAEKSDETGDVSDVFKRLHSEVVEREVRAHERKRVQQTVERRLASPEVARKGTDRLYHKAMERVEHRRKLEESHSMKELEELRSQSVHRRAEQRQQRPEEKENVFKRLYKDDQVLCSDRIRLGQRVSAQALPVMTTHEFCACGATFTDDSVFCRVCGVQRCPQVVDRTTFSDVNVSTGNVERTSIWSQFQSDGGPDRLDRRSPADPTSMSAASTSLRSSLPASPVDINFSSSHFVSPFSKVAQTSGLDGPFSRISVTIDGSIASSETVLAETPVSASRTSGITAGATASFGGSAAKTGSSLDVGQICTPIPRMSSRYCLNASRSDNVDRVAENSAALSKLVTATRTPKQAAEFVASTTSPSRRGPQLSQTLVSRRAGVSTARTPPVSPLASQTTFAPPSRSQPGALARRSPSSPGGGGFGSRETVPTSPTSGKRLSVNARTNRSVSGPGSKETTSESPKSLRKSCRKLDSAFAVAAQGCGLAPCSRESMSPPCSPQERSAFGRCLAGNVTRLKKDASC